MRSLRSSGLRRTTDIGEDVNPSAYIVNLADCMLVLAAGFMVALLAHYGSAIAAIELDRANLEEVDPQVMEGTLVGSGSYYVERGTVYQDPNTGVLYMVVTNEADIAELLEDVIDEERSELLQAALDFGEISASEVMTARVDIEAVDIDDSWDEIYAALCESSHSRIPVYEGSIDNVVGILLQNRFFKSMLDKKRPSIRRGLLKPCFVYKATKLPDVLDALRKSGQHLAVVTDEYGGVCGIITMEDVLEQLVGEIWDETDEVEPELIERPDGSYELDGDMSIGDFCELLERDEDAFETESSTIGGWAIEQFGRFPEAGQSFDWEDLRVTVLAMDGRRVDRLLVEKQGNGE